MTLEANALLRLSVSMRYSVLKTEIFEKLTDEISNI